MNRLADQVCAALRVHLAGGRLRVPEAGRVLWRLFGELHKGRTWHDAGPNPIGPEAIAAWAGLMRWPLQSHHVRVIRAIDDAWLQHFYSPRQDKSGRSEAVRPRASQPITPALFDAVVGG